jgi:hypothetical protein
MFDRTDLRAAVEAGALSRDAADRLEAFLKTRSDPDRMLDPENLRFLANFNDIFLAIGMAILVIGVSVASGLYLGPMVNSGPTAALVAVPVLVAAWMLAEYFAGRRRLLLPSMVLAVTICLAAGAIGTALMAPNQDSIANFEADRFFAGLGYAGFGAAAIAALAVHLRFRLAFALLLFALSVAGLVYTAIAQAGQGNLLVGGAATLAVGLATLAAAILFDARDPTRSTLSSDRAFWLHMAAAPQIIFGVRGLILGSGFSEASGASALAILLVLIAFGVLSLALNRRALIVSGLITFATAIGALLNSVSGGNEGTTIMLTLLVVGGSIVLLGGGWRTARRWLLKALPTGGFAGRIFPPEPA